MEQESKRKINNLEYGTTESESGVDIGSRYDEEADNEEEDPEDDPDVQDIRWFWISGANWDDILRKYLRMTSMWRAFGDFDIGA